MNKTIFFIYWLAGVVIAGGCSSCAEKTVRVMSYNVRNCIGLDHATDYGRVANVILEAAPDVVALQELDSVTNRSQQTDVLAQLAEKTKMYAVFGASISFDGGKYGVGILSKTPPVAWKRVPLPGREEARSLLIAEFADYVFCCTHFSLNEEDRRASVEAIREAVKGYKKPALLAGDINDSPDSPVLEAFRKDWKILSDTEQPTFPADKPNRTIDYLMGYVSGGGADYSTIQTNVVPEAKASDHRPVYANVRLVFNAR